MQRKPLRLWKETCTQIFTLSIHKVQKYVFCAGLFPYKNETGKQLIHKSLKKQNARYRRIFIALLLWPELKLKILLFWAIKEEILRIFSKQTVFKHEILYLRVIERRLKSRIY